MRRVLLVAVVAAIASLIVVPVAAGWAWPADGPVLRPFALAGDEYEAGQHRGIDIGAAVGEPVRAPAAGTVSFAGPVPAGGRAVTIQTADGYAVTLLQLGAVAVARGASVAEGEVVGQVGESEDAVTTAPHVHLGIRVAAEPNGYVDPLASPAVPARTPLAAEPAPPRRRIAAPAPRHRAGAALPRRRRHRRRPPPVSEPLPAAAPSAPVVAATPPQRPAHTDAGCGRAAAGGRAAAPPPRTRRCRAPGRSPRAAPPPTASRRQTRSAGAVSSGASGRAARHAVVPPARRAAARRGAPRVGLSRDRRTAERRRRLAGTTLATCARSRATRSGRRRDRRSCARLTGDRRRGDPLAAARLCRRRGRARGRGRAQTALVSWIGDERTPARQKILVAVAWPYANGPRHIGHVAGFGVRRTSSPATTACAATTSSWSAARTSTARRSWSPRDKDGGSARVSSPTRYNEIIREDLRRLGLSYDLFTRTTTQNHHQVVRDVFRTLYENGYIVEQTTTGAFSAATGRTLPDRYIEGTCPICGFDRCARRPVRQLRQPARSRRPDRPAVEDRRHAAGLPGDDAPLSRPARVQGSAADVDRAADALAAERAQLLAQLVKDLKPRPVTRDLDWGVPIPVPGYEDARTSGSTSGSTP